MITKIKEDESEHIEITMDIGCANMCDYCPQDLFINTYFNKYGKNSERHMTLENIKKYFSTIPKDLEVHFAGFSEPLVGDEFLDILQWLTGEGYKSTIFTKLNGVELKVLKKAIEIGVEAVNIHITDNNNRTLIKEDESYIDKISKALRILKHKDVYTMVTCLGEVSENLKEVLNKYDSISLNIGSNFINGRAGQVKREYINETEYRTNSIDCCKSLNRNLKFNVLLPNGIVTLCCMDFGLNHILGNLKEQSYEEVHNRDMANHVRERMEDIDKGDIICRHCDFSFECEY